MKMNVFSAGAIGTDSVQIVPIAQNTTRERLFWWAWKRCRSLGMHDLSDRIEDIVQIMQTDCLRDQARGRYIPIYWRLKHAIDRLRRQELVLRPDPEWRREYCRRLYGKGYGVLDESRLVALDLFASLTKRQQAIVRYAQSRFGTQEPTEQMRSWLATEGYSVTLSTIYRDIVAIRERIGEHENKNEQRFTNTVDWRSDDERIASEREAWQYK